MPTDSSNSSHWKLPSSQHTLAAAEVGLQRSPSTFCRGARLPAATYEHLLTHCRPQQEVTVGAPPSSAQLVESYCWASLRLLPSRHCTPTQGTVPHAQATAPGSAQGQALTPFAPTRKARLRREALPSPSPPSVLSRVLSGGFTCWPRCPRCAKVARCWQLAKVAFPRNPFVRPMHCFHQAKGLEPILRRPGVPVGFQ